MVDSIFKQIGSVIRTEIDSVQNNLQNNLQTDIDTKFGQTDALTTVTTTNKLVTQSDISTFGGGDMLKSVYDTNNNGKVDNAENSDMVNNLTVETSVPLGAVFTDTVYTHPATHSIAEVSGLQTALDGKVDDSQVLTNVPAGAIFTDTVYTHPATHSIAEVSGLQVALDGKVDDSQVLTNVPAGAIFTDTVYTHPATHSIAEVSGLQAELDNKLNLTGGEVTGSIIPATNITYDLGSPTKMWRDIYVGPGSLYVNGQKVLEENAGTITISADIDQNVQIKTTGAGDVEFYPSGTGVIQMKGTLSVLGGENLTSSDGNPINCPVGFTSLNIGGTTNVNDIVVAGNLTVSGTTTNVNTETLVVADNIITLNSDVTGTPTENSGITVERGDLPNAQLLWNESIDAWQVSSNGGSTFDTITKQGEITTTSLGLDNVDNTSDINKPISTATQTALDGKSDNHSHPYLPLTDNGTKNYTAKIEPSESFKIGYWTSADGWRNTLSLDDGNLTVTTHDSDTTRKVWTELNDGAGSGLDADTLDGLESTQFLRSDVDDTMSANLTFDTTNTGVNWAMNSDGASIKFYNTGDGDTNSRLEFATSDNGNEFFRFVHFNPGSTEHELMTLKYNGTGGDLDVTGNITVGGTKVILQTDLTAGTINPKFGTTIGMNNDNAILYFNDGTNVTRDGYWTNKDGFEIRGDGNVKENVVLQTGNLEITQNAYIVGNLGVGGTVDGRDVATDGTKLDGIEAGATADQTASEILTLLKTVDGAGSGLDADTLDSVEVSSLARTDVSETFGGAVTFSGGITLNSNLAWNTNKNILVNGESSIDISGGTFQVYDTGNTTHALYIPYGGQVQIGNAGLRGLLVNGPSDVNGNITATGRVTAGAAHINKPSDSWTGGNHYDISSYGYLYTHGGYGVSLSVNGYRNSSNQWTSLGANGSDDAALLHLESQGGDLVYYASTSWPTGSGSNPPEKFRIDGETGRVTVTSGSTGGIAFPDNAFGGSGDTASITLQNPSGGESTELTITMTNDASDIVNIKTPSTTGLKHNSNTVWTAANDGSGSGLDADTLDGTQLNTLVASLRANDNISGGGTVTFNASGYLKNSARFIVIANGKGSFFSTSGHFDITIPTSGTITGVGGATDKTATADGIPLSDWEALYYILPIGSTNTSLDANFRVARYTADFEIPHNWVLIANRNGDGGQKCYVIGKYGLEPGESIDTTLYDARNAAYATNADKLDGIQSTSFLRSDATDSMTGDLTINGDLQVNGSFSASGNILTRRYIQIFAVERDAIIKDRVNYVGDITLPFNCTVVELRAQTNSGTTLVEFKNNGQTMTQINATSTGNSTTVLQNTVAPKYTPLTFDTTSSSGSGLTIIITVQEEV